jgi:MFS family permease
MALKGRLGPLEDSQFRLFWIGRTASVLGDAVMPVTLVFAVLSLGGSASEIGLILATAMVVRVVLLLLGGAVADLFPRRVVLIGSDAAVTAVQVTVGVLLLTGRGSIGVLLGAAVFYGAASALSKPALTGILPQIVRKERLQQANALVGISQSTVQIAGPALAGVIVAVWTPGVAYLLDAATFVVGIVTLLLLRVPEAARIGGTNLLRGVVTGWRELVSRPWYWTALVSHAVWNMGSCAFVVLGPIIVNEHAGGPASWGLVAASMAAGSLLGGIVLLRWRPRRPLVIGHLALLLTAPQLASLITPLRVDAIMVLTLAGASGVAFINHLWTTATQQLIPENVISRLSSYDWLVSFTIAPLGYVMAGPLSERFGTSATLTVAIALVTLPVLGLLAMPGIRRVRQGKDGRMYVQGAEPPDAAEDDTPPPVDVSGAAGQAQDSSAARAL